MDTLFSRHKLVALQFSAGKDSAACLKLLQPWLEQVVVIWGNSGDAYPETLRYMERVCESVPHFVEAKGQQPAYVRTWGYPSELPPFAGTRLGKAAERRGGPFVSSVSACCWNNLWGPVLAATKSSGATALVRGDKAVDVPRSVVEPGTIQDGLEIVYPLYKWSDADVLGFVGADLPESYARGLTSSLDCRTCTAYLSHNGGRLRDLATADPAAHAEIAPVLLWLRQETARHLTNLDEVLRD